MVDRQAQHPITGGPTRRDFLYGLGSTLGTVAFNALLQEEASAGDRSGDPLSPKPPHFPAKAKRCIFLFMEGGPSHIDTFDPKPKLDELHMEEFKRNSKFASAMASGKRYYVKSPFGFRQVGDSGIWMSEGFQHLPDVADELCVYRGCTVDSINHPTACYQMNTGDRFGGDPAAGAWVTYGLGTMNQNLPAFVVLPERKYPQGGAANWSNGFLPAQYQGTPLRAQGAPILNLNPPPGVTRKTQRKNLDLLHDLNANYAPNQPNHDELAARMASYEMAFRMQAEVPDIVDIEQEDEATKEMYGVGQKPTHSFGRRCLLARRLLESGTRFVQIWSSGWDSHDYISKAHANRMREVDQPIAALIKDLKRRGMLEDTLIVWAGEFGRTADNGVRGGEKRAGRDHNNHAMSIWLAGGGVNAGHVVGATDEIGQKAVEKVHPLKDLHVTLLRLLGLDDHHLRYFHAGRYQQLSQDGGDVIKELLA